MSKPAPLRRRKVLSTKLTDAEAKAIRRAARQVKVTPAAWLRWAAFAALGQQVAA